MVEPPLELRRLRILMCASTVAFLSLLAAFWVWIPSSGELDRPSGLLLFDLCGSLPFLLPYAFIPLRLLTGKFQSALTLALAMGCALLVPGVYLIRFVLEWEKNWWILGNLILALLMQPVLLVIAAKTLLTTPRRAKSRIKLLGSLAYGGLLFGVFWGVYSPVPKQLGANEGTAEFSLFETGLSVWRDAAYSAQHSYSMVEFPDTAPSTGSKCQISISYPKKQTDGYVFEYSGTSALVTPEGCTRFNGFRMTARPIVYRRTGIRSFFLDESMVEHATSENRPANASDPIVWTMQDWVSHHRPA